MATLTPDAFWARLQPWCRTFGITRVADITGLDDLGLPTCVAIRPASRALSVSQGKGLSGAQARISAVMESIETWHAERIDGPIYHGTAARARADGLALADLHGFAHRPTRLPLEAVPTQFVEVERLLGGASAWVPLDCLSTDFCYDIDAPPVFMRSSNGLAAGQTRDAALLHALCEVVERDAVQRWMQGDAFQRPARRVTAGPDSPLAPLLERCAAAGQLLLAWDIEAAAGLHCHAVMLLGSPDARAARDVGAFSGFGCSPDPRAALQAAVLEAVQSRLTMISGARDDLFPEEFERCRDAVFARAMWDRHSGSAPLDGPADAALAQADAHAVAARIERTTGQPVYWRDLGRHDVPFAVVRALVPGMQQLGMDQLYYCQHRRAA